MLRRIISSCGRGGLRPKSEHDWRCAAKGKRAPWTSVESRPTNTALSQEPHGGNKAALVHGASAA